MRVLDCGCGKRLEANDDGVYGQVREPVDQDHPEMQPGDEQVRGIVSQGAYDE